MHIDRHTLGCDIFEEQLAAWGEPDTSGENGNVFTWVVHLHVEPEFVPFTCGCLLLPSQIDPTSFRLVWMIHVAHKVPFSPPHNAI